MNKKFNFLIFLLINIRLCFSDYDVNVLGSFENIYTSSPKNVLYFKLQILSGKYFEVLNFYGKVIIKKSNTIIGKLPSSENSFYFEHDGTSEYNLTYIFPDPFKICGIKISSKNSEYSSILNSSLTYYILREREMNFLIKNENPLVPKIVRVTLYLAYSYKVNVLWAKFEENNKNFTAKYIRDEKYIEYYAILSDNLKFMPIVYNPNAYQDLTYSISCLITLDIDKNSIIAKNTTICSNKNFNYYQIDSNASPFIEISFMKNTKLYLVENNFENKRIDSSISEYKLNNQTFLLLETDGMNKGCFSVIFFTDEDKTIIKDTDFKLTLFNSRSFKITIKNPSHNYHRIIFKTNDYFYLTKIILENKESEIITDGTIDKNYNKIFEIKSNEEIIPIELVFEKSIHYSLDYYEACFSYRGFDEEKEKKYTILIIIDVLLILVCCFIILRLVVYICSNNDFKPLEKLGYVDYEDKFYKVYLCRKRKSN